jgi:hypothetical protein
VNTDRPIVRRWTAEELAATVATLKPPTVDDVTITGDGRRLDTADKVRAYVDEVNRRRASETTRARAR